MKRFLLPAPPNRQGMIRLYEKDYHYLVRVRRLKADMCFDAVLPGGEETQVHILSTVDNILIGECLGIKNRQPSPIPPIALFQGLPKGAKMDLIARQAAESGVSIVAPFESEYSAIHGATDSAGEKATGKAKRWERIVREARQQSGSAIETEIRPPCSFDGLLASWNSLKKEFKAPLGIVLHQEPLEKGSFHDYLGKCPDLIALAVGPEGGFSPKEVSLFLAAGFKPLLMGDTILRTETAALCGIAVIRMLLLESESWKPQPKG